MRGLAAGFIVLRHTPELFHAASYRSYLAVDFFFVLSGLVIARAYRDRLASGELTGARFMLLRYIRLSPLALVAAVLALGWLAFRQPSASAGSVWVAVMVSVLFIPFRMGADIHLFALNQPMWSLFVEIVSNAGYGLVARRMSRAALGWALVALFLGLAAFGLKDGGLNWGFEWGGGLRIGVLRGLFGFGAGVWLLGLLGERRLGGWAAAVGFGGLGLVLALPDLGRANGLVDLICVGAVFPALVWLGAGVGGGAFSGFYRLLGTLSYPVYLLHWPLHSALLHVLAWKGIAPSFGIGLVFVAALVGLALGLERWYELPVRRWLTRSLA